MYEKLRVHILPQLISPNDKILVAVSGGPDSMALCHVLLRYAKEQREDNISLVLTHVHHGVRKESDAEASMVEDVAKTWGIPYMIHRFNAKEYARKAGLSFQEGAREWRYARWRQDMMDAGCNLLATAHHLNDQAETILYRILRGTGTTGLTGIYPKKDHIIRPLLSVSKEEILAYCHEQGIPYALDRSNEEPVYDRNRIRLKLLPELARDYNPQIVSTLGNMAEVLRWDEEYLNQKTEDAWKKYLIYISAGEVKLDHSIFTEPEAILSRLIRKAASMVSPDPRGLGFIYVKSIIENGKRTGWSQDLPGIRVKVEHDRVIFQKARSKNGSQIEYPLKEVRLILGEWVEFSGGVRFGLFKEGQIPDISHYTYTKISAKGLSDIAHSLVCRTRREGDTMWFRQVGHKSLKKVFQEEKIDAEKRASIPLVASGNNVIWIPGIRRSDTLTPVPGEEVVYCVFNCKTDIYVV